MIILLQVYWHRQQNISETRLINLNFMGWGGSTTMQYWFQMKFASFRSVRAYIALVCEGITKHKQLPSCSRKIWKSFRQMSTPGFPHPLPYFWPCFPGQVTDWHIEQNIKSSRLKGDHGGMSRRNWVGGWVGWLWIVKGRGRRVMPLAVRAC